MFSQDICSFAETHHSLTNQTHGRVLPLVGLTHLPLEILNKLGGNINVFIYYFLILAMLCGPAMFLLTPYTFLSLFKK